MKSHQTRRLRGVLTAADVAGATAEELRELLAGRWLPPIAGGAPDDDRRGRETEVDDDDDETGRTVPLATLQRERRRRAEVEKDLEEVNDRLRAIEDKDRSEVDRLKEENATLRAENETLRSSIETGRKQSLVSEAAREAGFHKPGAALSMLDAETLAEIDSEDAAKAAVKTLAKRESWMLKDKPTDARRGVEKILKDGREVDASKAGGEESEPEPGLGTLRAAYAESGDGSQD